MRDSIIGHVSGPRSRRAFLRLVLAGGLGVGALAAGVWPALPRGQAMPAAQTSLPPGRLALLARNSLWLVDADGSERRLATGTGGWLQDPAWSPDGTQLTYTHFQVPPPAAAAATQGVPWPTGDLYVVRPLEPDAAPVVLARAEAPGEGFISAAWLPDGRALYAVRRRPAADGLDLTTDLVRIDLDSGERELVDVGVPPTEVAVAADGTLAVVGNLGAAATGVPPAALFLLAGDGTRTEVASTAQGFEFLALPRFAPDRQRLAFAAGGGPRGAAAPGSAVAVAGSRPAARGPAARVGGVGGAATVHAHGIPAWPWVAGFDSGDLRRAAAEAFDDLASLAWLADGRRLLILDAYGLAVVDSGDGTLLRIPGIIGTAFAWFGG